MKKILSYILCATMLLTMPFYVWAEENVQTEAPVETGVTAEEANGLLEGVSKHLLMYARDESLSYGSLYQGAMEKVLEENPQLYEAALRGMLESIDEYSEYYDSEESTVLMENVTGGIVGIGVTIDFSDIDAAKIVSVIPDTPAERAGLEVGDILVRADGYELRGVKSELVLNHVRGDVGTEVYLEVERDGQIIGFKMVREEIVGTSVTYEVMEEDGIKVMYICVHGFVMNTAEKFEEALNAADAAGITNIIIDVRDNGGGILEQAIAMADNFVPKGKTITTEDHKLVLLNRKYSGTKVEKNKYKIVVLINEYSASASEVLAAALDENEEAVLVGEKTYGKGTIQTITALGNGGMIKYTSGYYLTPNGNNINGIGVVPDINVSNRKEKVDADQFGDFGYTKVYREGDVGEEVKTAKEILSYLGIFVGEINDVYDRDLYYAVHSFQTRVGVFPYGVLDFTTQLQIHNYLRMIEVEVDDQLNTALSEFGINMEDETAE